MEVPFLRPFKTTKEQLRIVYNRGVKFSNRKRMNYLENKLLTIDITKIQQTLGFPNNWNRLVPNLEQ